MLRSLSINNYILIDSLEFYPGDKLTTISGETGAGKSMLLGGLGLVLGKRADAKALYDPSKKCTVEAVFELLDKKLEVFFLEKDLDFEKECIVRREILASGKSRAFINDTPVTLDILKGLGQNLVDIHSQHDALQINQEDFQIGILDVFGDNLKLLEEYKDNFFKLEGIKRDLIVLKEKKAKAETEFDYNNFLLEELLKMNLVIGEEEGLEQALRKEENIESVRNSLATANQVFQNQEYPLLDMLYQAKQALDNVKQFSDSISALSERMESLILELREIEVEIDSEGQNLGNDPEKLKIMGDRYDEINRLFKKHNVSTSEGLLEEQKSLEEKTLGVQDMELEISRLENRISELDTKTTEMADLLSAKRKNVSLDLEKKIVPLLSDLGMNSGKLEIDIEKDSLNPLGYDRVTFLFTANKGHLPKPVKETASGGEMSRLMLTFKFLLGGKSQFPTMIFDEIDAGVSGEIALQMGKMIAEISRIHQIICITHLPQVAAIGEKHFKVIKSEKGPSTSTEILELGEKERIEEIAEMIGGKSHSSHTINSAKELLKQKI
jgi:DNA repair protein RecN (Recombination protein N)